jgi:hypothetical protein
MDMPMSLRGSIFVKNKLLQILTTMISNFFNLKSTKDQGNHLTLIRQKIDFSEKLHWLLESGLSTSKL